MTIVAQRATLVSHIKVVLITPFAVALGGIAANRLKVALIIFIVGACFAAGVITPAWPKWREMKTELMIAGGSVAFLMILAVLLTTFDHIRYAGWTSDGPKEAGDIALKFALAAIAGNTQQASLVSVQGGTSRLTEFNSQLNELHSRLKAGTVVTVDALSTTDHEIFRRIAPTLSGMHIQPSEVIAFVPVLPFGNSSGANRLTLLRVVLDSSEPCYLVRDASVIEIARPPVLR